MIPVKLLIKEHITIKKMIKLLSFFYSNPEKINSQFLSTIIDFFSTYVDKCHHGKEEKILFQKLKSKKLLPKDENLMYELIEEHKLGRKLVQELKVNKACKEIEKIRKTFSQMISLYTSHIKKENSVFFYPAFKYFTQAEKQQILQEFFDLDKNIIHDKYLQVVEELTSLIQPINNKDKN